jgi:hypothetical protein
VIKDFYTRVASKVVEYKVDSQPNVVTTQQGLVTHNLTPREMKASIPAAIQTDSLKYLPKQSILKKNQGELLSQRSEILQSYHKKQVSFED